MIFAKNTIENKLKIEIATSDEMQRSIELWHRMYTDRSEKTLGLPAAIANELARLVTIEMKSEITGSKRADFLNKYYQDVIDNIKTPIEYGLAKGGLAMKPYVDDGKIIVDFIPADCFYPTKFSQNGQITGAIFVQRLTKGRKYYTRLEIHDLTDTVYTVQNKAFCSDDNSSIGKSISLASVAEWADLSDEVKISNIKMPLFGYFKNPLANNIDPSSPLGISVFARAVDLINDADRQYSRLLWEFESGERALYVSEVAFRKDQNGRVILPNKRLYKALNVDNADLFEDWTPEFRDTSIINGLNKILQRIEFNCSLAYGTLSDPQNVDKTAEEIKASKQRSYAAVCDIQKSLKTSLENLIYAMNVWCDIYNLETSGEYEVSFDFDDSIIADRKSEFEEKQKLVMMGAMQLWEFRMWYFGETEEQAKGMVDD